MGDMIVCNNQMTIILIDRKQNYAYTNSKINRDYSVNLERLIQMIY